MARRVLSRNDVRLWVISQRTSRIWLSIGLCWSPRQIASIPFGNAALATLAVNIGTTGNSRGFIDTALRQRTATAEDR
jgi:hypothetical protein